MFDYSDPAGREFLGLDEVAAGFRAKLQETYNQSARRSDSAFTWLEAFQQLSSEVAHPIAIEWLAFPLLATAGPSGIDRDRLRWQDEYVEWTTELKNDKPHRITFTTEFREYFEAFAEVGTEALIQAIKDVIPEASPKPAELFGAGPDPELLPSIGRANRFRNHLKNNPWNNGKKGILCLTHGSSTLSALFILITECAVRTNQGSPHDTCTLVAGACVSGRSSDPNICATAQTAVRNGLGLSLIDPVGVRIVRLEGTWRVHDKPIDVNNPNQQPEIWQVSRNGRRGQLNIVEGLTLDGNPVASGAQVSGKLRVAAEVVAAPEAALPDWARIGQESFSRGPQIIV